MKPHFEDETVTLWQGDALSTLTGLPDGSVDCIVTSRPSSRHEHVFLLSKSPRYWFDLEPIMERATGQTAGNTKAAKKAYGEAARLDDGRRFGHNETSTLDQARTERRPGDVWSIPTAPFAEAHFAVMPLMLAEKCVQAGCKPGGTVLDPYSGSGTTGLAAARHGRKYVGIDLNPEYLDLSLRTRLAQMALLDEGGAA